MPSRRLLAAVTASVLLGSACGGAGSDASGPVLYAESCASCHGDRGEGGIGPAVGAGSNSEILTDEQLAGVIRVGPGTMPGFPRLSDAQVDSIVAFLRTLQTP